MPVVINGSGSITGLSVGGLPDGSVDADTLASNAVTAAKLASGVGGKVQQIIQSEFSTQTQVNSSSFVDIGLSATITPSASSSKILILVFLSVQGSNFYGNGDTFGFGFNIVRGSTNIADGDSGQHYISVPEEDDYIVFQNPHSRSFLDSPNTTSATTYKIQGKESNVNANCQINGSSQKSQLILMEVAA